MDLCLSGCSRAYNIYLKYQNLHIDNSENTGTLLLYSSIHSSPFYIIIIIIIEVDKREIHFYHYINLLIYPLLFSSLFSVDSHPTRHHSLTPIQLLFLLVSFVLKYISFLDVTGSTTCMLFYAVILKSVRRIKEKHTAILYFI